MNAGLRLALLLVACFALRALGQEVDERYVEIYNLIQKADTLREAGQTRGAVESYQEAERALRNLQASHPLWNEKVVSYRLGYISARLANLSTSTNALPTQVVADVSHPTNQMRQLEGEMQRLQTQNSLLEAKLREALSVQPAANDPRQLVRVEERLTNLEKERDLLRVTLDQEKAKSSKPIDSRVALREQQILAEVEQRLSQEMETSAALRRENELLRGQVAAAGAPVAAGDNVREMQLANATMAALRATNISLRTERILLEERLAEITRQVPNQSESDLVRSLRLERDDLRRRLDLAMVQLASGANNSAPAGDAAARELQSVRAKLAAYESKQVPYSPEELALFKRSDLKVSLSDANAVPKKVRELPPGAGQLMAQAQSAMEKGQMPEAERLLLQVLRQDEQNVYTLATLASVQMEQKRFPDAEQNIRRALAVDAQDPASLFLLGRLKYDQQSYDEALEALSLSAKLIPDEPRTQFLLGRTLIQKGSPGPAEAALRRAVQLKPGWGEAHHALSVVYATQEPPFIELAQWHYQKARAGGFPRDQELEKWIEQKKVAVTP